ncbi:hypothetical protein IFM89_020184, partial [Coptis chinensis]
ITYLATFAFQVPPELYDSFIAAIDKGHKNNAKQKHASRSPSDSRCSINGRCIQHVPSFDWWRDDSSFIRYSCATEPSHVRIYRMNTISELAIAVPPELYDSFIAAIDKGHIKTMPNRSMPAAPHLTPGALLMGDAFNMCHPLTGGGMTVALSDIVVLQNLLKPLRNLNDAPSLCRYLESFYTLRKGLKDNSSRALIGVKRMGELDSKPFQESCKRKYSADEADEKALVLCSQWEEYLKDPDWHPFKIIQVKEDVHQVCLLTLL